MAHTAPFHNTPNAGQLFRCKNTSMAWRIQNIPMNIHMLHTQVCLAVAKWQSMLRIITGSNQILCYEVNGYSMYDRYLQRHSPLLLTWIIFSVWPSNNIHYKAWDKVFIHSKISRVAPHAICVQFKPGIIHTVRALCCVVVFDIYGYTTDTRTTIRLKRLYLIQIGKMVPWIHKLLII